nr:YhgE/Pip family protein [Secundilactobacillus oryzae]
MASLRIWRIAKKTINQITNDLDTIRTTVDGLTGGSGTSVAGYVNAARTTIQTKLDNLTTALNEGQSSLTQFKQLQAGVAQLTTASHTLNNGLITATNSQNLGKLVTGIGTLNKSSSALNSGASQLASGTGQLNASSGQLTSGASTLAAGTAKLASKGGALQSGANQLGSAAGQLSSGADKLYDGGQTLGNGLDTLGEGTTALHDQLDKGAKKVQKLKATPKTYKMMSAPVDLKHKETAKVDNNGTGMAPYMISVGLFVGGLTFTIMYDLYSPRRYPDKGRRWWFSKASVVAVMAVLQSIAIIGLLMAVDGLNPIHPWATLGVTMLTAFAS